VLTTSKRWGQNYWKKNGKGYDKTTTEKQHKQKNHSQNGISMPKNYFFPILCSIKTIFASNGCQFSEF
jgi:hypothetical protein